MRRFRVLAVVSVVSVVIASLGTLPPAGAAEVNHVTVTSQADGLGIRITVYKPTGASSTNKKPVILHSHGWGGSRTSAADAFVDWLDAGFGMVSIDQRGHGETGGTAHVQNPDIEGQDIISVIDYVATLDWVKKDLDENNAEIADDPVLGAIGGSYGGGYQLISALTEVRDTGTTRYNALAPEITWNNLSRSLAPNDVPRTLWNTVLYGIGIPRLPDYVHKSFVLGTATATFPNGEIPETYNLKDRFYRNSAAWFAANNYHLDIPVLFGQGISDNLFPLNEAFHNYEEVLTPAARSKSIVIGYNGGHNLPAVVPPGNALAGPLTVADTCSGTGGFAALSRTFFATVFAGGDSSALMPNPYNVSTVAGTCLRVDTLDTYTSLPVGLDGVVAAPTAGSGPISFEIAQGPITLAGIPILRGDLTSLGVDARAFFALSVGATPASAQIIQNNVVPLRQLLPVVGEPLSLELPGVAIEIPAGQNLYLTVTAVSDMFAGTSRTPGAFLIENTVVDLPVA